MPRSTILDAVYEAAKDLHDIGLISDQDMAKYDDIRPIPGSFSPADIRRIRQACGDDEQMFARHLGVTVGTVHKWEAGTKKPSGPVRRLLDLIDRKGIQAIY